MDTLQLVSDLKRTSATVSTHFDVNDNVRLFADLFGYQAEAKEIVDQTAYNATIFGASSCPITLPANHPTLTPQARATLAGLGADIVPDFACASRSGGKQRALRQRSVSGGGWRHRRFRSGQPAVHLGNVLQLRQQRQATFYSTQLDRQRS